MPFSPGPGDHLPAWLADHSFASTIWIPILVRSRRALAEIHRHVGGTPRQDDIALIVVRREK